MQVQVHTDNHLVGSGELTQFVEGEVHGSLDRFGTQITRIAVHLNDVNGHKMGDHEKRCLMEARIAGHQPVAVSCEASSLDEAVRGAAVKLESSLDRLFDKLGHHKGLTSFGGDQTI